MSFSYSDLSVLERGAHEGLEKFLAGLRRTQDGMRIIAMLGSAFNTGQATL
jgi:hypothetical protein